MINKWFSKFIRPGSEPPPESVPELPALTADEKAELSGLIRLRVTGGFDEKSAIYEAALDFLHPREWTAGDRAWLTGEVDQHWDGKLSAQLSWPRETDFVRLDRVFQQLRASGILALHCAGNTQSDGWDDVRQFWDEAGGPMSGIDGAIFYHGQDVEHVAGDGSLYLAFGALPSASRSAMDVAGQVAAALKSAGFNVTLPASESQRILITGLTWQKPSPD